MRDYKLTLREPLRSPSSRQSRKPVQYQNIVSAIALDKIQPLSHLHRSAAFTRSAVPATGQEWLFRLECAKRPGDARETTENRQVRSNLKFVVENRLERDLISAAQISGQVKG